MRPIYSTLLILLMATACHTGHDTMAETDGGDSVVFTPENIHTERKNVASQPVKSYTETTKTFARDDEFKVSLNETRLTLNTWLKSHISNWKSRIRLGCLILEHNLLLKLSKVILFALLALLAF